MCGRMQDGRESSMEGLKVDCRCMLVEFES